MVTSMLFPFGHLALTIDIMVYVTANSQRLKPEKSLIRAIFLFFFEKSLCMSKKSSKFARKFV